MEKAIKANREAHEISIKRSTHIYGEWTMSDDSLLRAKRNVERLITYIVELQAFVTREIRTLSDNEIAFLKDRISESYKELDEARDFIEAANLCDSMINWEK